MIRRLLTGWWHRRLRTLDERMLWLPIVEEAPSLEIARMAFAKHCYNDEAWQALGAQKIEERLTELVELERRKQWRAAQ